MKPTVDSTITDEQFCEKIGKNFTWEEPIVTGHFMFRGKECNEYKQIRNKSLTLKQFKQDVYNLAYLLRKNHWSKRKLDSYFKKYEKYMEEDFEQFDNGDSDSVTPFQSYCNRVIGLGYLVADIICG